MTASLSEKREATVDHGDTVPDVGTAVQLAHAAEERKSSPWTPSMFRLYLVLACAYLCGCLVSQSFPIDLMRLRTLADMACRTGTMVHLWAA